MNNRISYLSNRYRCNSKDTLIEQQTQKKEDTATLCRPTLPHTLESMLVILKYSFIGTRILISLTWRTRCIRNAPCRCTAYVVSSFSAVSSGQQYTYSQPQCYLSTNTHTNRKSPELHRLPSLFRQLEWKRSRVSSGLISSV